PALRPTGRHVSRSAVPPGSGYPAGRGRNGGGGPPSPRGARGGRGAPAGVSVLALAPAADERDNQQAPMIAEPAIRLSRVSKSYVIWRRLRRRPGRGIHDVSLDVPRGIIFGLLGLNGAGKTTTMKLLVGLMRPDAGTIRVLGGDPADPGVRARLG